MNLYLSSLPTYKTPKDAKNDGEVALDADDPKNRDAVEKILFGN